MAHSLLNRLEKHVEPGLGVSAKRIETLAKGIPHCHVASAEPHDIVGPPCNPVSFDDLRGGFDETTELPNQLRRHMLDTDIGAAFEARAAPR